MSGLAPSSKAGTVQRKLRPYSFRTKLLVYFGLTFALGLLADSTIGLYGIPFTDYRGEYGLRRSEAFRGLNQLADTKKTELLQLIVERRGDAVTITESPIFRAQVARLCTLLKKARGADKTPTGPYAVLMHSEEYRLLAEHLTIFKKSYMGQYETIRLADSASGRIVVSTDAKDIGMDLSGDASFGKAKVGAQDEVLRVLKDPRNGNPYLAIYRAVKSTSVTQSGENGVTAVLILYLKPDVFLRALTLSSVELGKTGEILLVTQNGELLTPLKHPLPDGTVLRPLESRVETKTAILAAEGNEGAMVTRDYGGVPVLAAFRHLRLNAEMGWGMVVKKDQSEVFAAIHQLMVYYALKSTVLCLLALGLTYAMATRLARPIKLLSRTAKRIEEGNFSARAPAEGVDELGLLAGSFNSMVQRIQHWHEALEEEVKIRTGELVALNTELECEIDERSRVEEALRTSERSFRELLETVQMVAVILDWQGNITFCNDFLLKLTGWSREELLGRNWFDTFIPEETTQAVKAVFSEALATSTVAPHFENPIVTRSGARRSVIWDNTMLWTPDGALAGVASLGTDVTEQRTLEELLRHSQKMEAVGQLAGGVAHDFNNLLTAIIGNCELIKLKTGSDSPASSYVEQILRVSAKAARLTHGLLAFSRKQFLSTVTVDVNDCVRAVEQLLSRLIGEDIDFRLALTETKLPIRADRDQMEQVLVNLATNARDAMPNGGELLIETRRVDLDRMSAKVHGLDQEGTYAVIQVSDTGSGMDEAIRDKIFEPFFTTKEVGKGTGLGLSMVFGTIRQHGGYIDVYSELGKGTVFKIYLPVILDVPVGESNGGPQQAAPRGDELLLVVEDNDEVRKVTASILEAHGYRVIAAANGEEAIARFMEHRNRVSLVILDVIMPKMNGKEVYDVLRKVKPDLKALFTSGYTSDILNRKVLMDGGLNFLQKPVPSLELLQKVRELLDNG